MHDKSEGTDLHLPEGCMTGIAMHDKSVGTDLHLPEGCMAGIAMHELPRPHTNFDNGIFSGIFS